MNISIKSKKSFIILFFLIIILIVSYLSLDTNIISNYVIESGRSKLIQLPSSVSKITISSDVPINIDIIESRDYEDFINGVIYDYYMNYTSSDSIYYEKMVYLGKTEEKSLLIYNTFNEKANVDVKITSKFLREVDSVQFVNCKDKYGIKGDCMDERRPKYQRN